MATLRTICLLQVPWILASDSTIPYVWIDTPPVDYNGRRLAYNGLRYDCIAFAY